MPSTSFEIEFPAMTPATGEQHSSSGVAGPGRLTIGRLTTDHRTVASGSQSGPAVAGRGDPESGPSSERGASCSELAGSSGIDLHPVSYRPFISPAVETLRHSSGSASRS